MLVNGKWAGDWQMRRSPAGLRGHDAARRGTIAAGTNEIQHNIIGERVLGLPKG